MTLTTEALETFVDNLSEIRTTLMAQVEEEIEALPQPIVTENEIANDLREKLYSMDVQKISEDRVRTINRITSFLEARKYPYLHRGRITDEDIARAKAHPIKELYTGKLRQSTGLCPFHSEKHPSFHIYEKKNRYYCFGCNAHGDSIAFYMNINNVSFIDAVRAL